MLFRSQGYVPGNIAIISMRANRMKSDADKSEVEKLVGWLQKPIVPKRTLIQDFESVMEVRSRPKNPRGKPRGRPRGGNYRLRTTIPAEVGKAIEARVVPGIVPFCDVVTGLIRKGLENDKKD